MKKTTNTKETPAKKVIKKKPDADLTILGKRIKDLRIKQGYTNYENFAFEHEIPRAQFGRYENGENLRYSNLVKIIRAFDITVEEFFKGIK
jgi:transcriptional regulator with XRE-family HTH domain